MRIQGLQKLTLLDYPGRTACTIFLGGCNFRCPFCHNAALVTGVDDFQFPEKEKGHSGRSMYQRRRAPDTAGTG